MTTYIGEVRNTARGNRFVDDSSGRALKLTTIPMQAADDPELNLIDLEPYVGKRISFEGDDSDDVYVWDADEQSIKVL